MKKIVPVFLIGFGLVALIMSFTNPEINSTKDHPQEIPQLDFPEDISNTLQTSCFDCHSAASSNIKAKGKLNFSKWENLSDAKKVGKLEGILETVKNADMPPKRYLEKNPSAALDQEQIDAIVKWATEESNMLIGTEN